MDKYLKWEIESLNRIKDKPILSSILNISGDIVATTILNAELIGIKTDQLIGLNARTATVEQISLLMPTLSEEELFIVQGNFIKLSELLDIVINQQIEISYINFMPYGGIHKPYLDTMIPIFGENLDVVGVKIIFTEYSFYGQSEYFRELSKPIYKNNHQKSIQKIESKTSSTLATRQQEILYLLANGFSQIDVAKILHISRGAVANIVSEQLCPKFHIQGSSTKLLVEKAKSLGLNKVMPSGLYKPFVIVLSKYHSED